MTTGNERIEGEFDHCFHAAQQPSPMTTIANVEPQFELEVFPCRSAAFTDDNGHTRVGPEMELVMFPCRSAAFTDDNPALPKASQNPASRNPFR